MPEDESANGSFTEAHHEQQEETPEEEQAVKRVSREETRRITGCRILFLVLIIAACALVSTVTYLKLDEEEKEDVQNSYELFVDMMKGVMTLQVDSLKEGMASLAEEITANGEGSFPYSTMNNFEVSAGSTRQRTGLEFMFYTPIVADREEWVTYAAEHTAWVERSRTMLQHDKDLSEEVALAYQTGNFTILPSIYTNNGTNANATGYAISTPIWQVSPPPFMPGFFLNFDTQSNEYLRKLTETIAKSKASAFSNVRNNMRQLAESGVHAVYHNSFHEQFVTNLNGEDYYDHPHSVVMQPVFDAFGSDQVAGFLLGVVAWDRYFAKLLPDEVNNIVAVLRNSCGDSFTYIIDGDKAFYVGEGNQYDESKNHTELTLALNLSDNDTSNGVDICSYKVNFYSSPEFEEQQTQDVPFRFAMSLTAVFAIMALSFLLYDFLNRRRNTRVVATAAHSDAILSSIFPTKVRDRLIEERAGNEAAKKNIERSSLSRMKNFLSTDSWKESKEETPAGTVDTSTPIADLFPETTILFADIAGFTAWSATREPAEVFTLLETLYHSFDKLARRRRVFKVETIGDCYVAATGVPEPQKDHALNMCRFARDALIKCRILVQELTETLGPETANLQLRVGIHSGAVTAGVLRGERSRFQLFGDSMNTASRMESTGVPNRIQVSADTAQILMDAGKDDWVKQRKEKIIAKGKGEMTTYWLNDVVITHSSTTSGSVISDDTGDELSFGE